MTDQNTTDPAMDPSVDPATEDGTSEVDKWKAQARKHEKAWLAKSGDLSLEGIEALKAKAAKFDELEEASKSELQKQTERATRAESDRAALQLRVERAEVAATKGVPVELLAGSTREELEAAADALIAFKGVAPKAPPATGQGNQGEPLHGQSEQITSRDVLKTMSPAEIVKAESEGRLDTILGKSK